MFFELVSILFAIAPDYGNEYIDKNWTSFKNVAPKINLNQNIYRQSDLNNILKICKSKPWKVDFT